LHTWVYLCIIWVSLFSSLIVCWMQWNFTNLLVSFTNFLFFRGHHLSRHKSHASPEDLSSHINASHKFINFPISQGAYLSMLPMFVMHVELNYSMLSCAAMQFAFNLCVNWFWISLIHVEPLNIMNFITINYHNMWWMFVLCNPLLWEICDFYESL
jgi:hypothetical protein